LSFFFIIFGLITCRIWMLLLYFLHPSCFAIGCRLGWPEEGFDIVYRFVLSTCTKSGYAVPVFDHLPIYQQSCSHLDIWEMVSVLGYYKFMGISPKLYGCLIYVVSWLLVWDICDVRLFEINCYDIALASQVGYI
jgi:hypothetical protein